MVDESADSILNEFASVQSAEHHEAIHPRRFAKIQLGGLVVLRLWFTHPCQRIMCNYIKHECILLLYKPTTSGHCEGVLFKLI